MAASVIASNVSTTAGKEDHKGDRARLVEYDDPILSRTITVDESFRRMEELVGTEDEAKNWRGIVISLLVIAFILAMIVTAIAMITKGKEKFEPGDPFPFDLMIDPSIQSTQPLFQLSYGDQNSYITLKENGTGKFIVLMNLSLPPNDEHSSTVIVPPSLFTSELEGLIDASLSPNGHYILLKLQPDGQTKPSYRIYEPNAKILIEDSHFRNGEELDYAGWIGNANKLIYIKDNSILYKPDVNDTPTSLSQDDDMVLNGLATRLYRDLLKRDILIWTSPDGSKIVFTKISQPKQRSKRSDDDESAVLDTEVVSLYVVDLNAANLVEAELKVENATSSRPRKRGSGETLLQANVREARRPRFQQRTESQEVTISASQDIRQTKTIFETMKNYGLSPSATKILTASFADSTRGDLWRRGGTISRQRC